MISLRLHNAIDYLLAVAYIATPYLLGFAHINYAHSVFMILGIAILGYSLLSDHPYSLSRALPLNMHNTFDVVCGIFVIFAPWIYGYREEIDGIQYSSHLVLGFASMVLVGLTERAGATRPADRAAADTTVRPEPGKTQVPRHKRAA